jgi:hypothetical protein
MKPRVVLITDPARIASVMAAGKYRPTLEFEHWELKGGVLYALRWRSTEQRNSEPK